MIAVAKLTGLAFRNVFIIPIFGGGLQYPPVQDKLLAWLPDRNADSDEKREVISSFNFFYNNCPLIYEYDPNGDLVLDPNGDPVTVGTDVGTLDTGWWPCEYRAPNSGEPGYAELLANDNGELYTGGVANTLTFDTFTNSDQVFWCDHTGKGIADYLPLTPSELIEVQEFFNCTVGSSAFTSGFDGGFE